MTEPIQAEHFHSKEFYTELAGTDGYNGYSLNIKTTITSELSGPVTTFVVYHMGEVCFETKTLQQAVDCYNNWIGAT